MYYISFWNLRIISKLDGRITTLHLHSQLFILTIAVPEKVLPPDLLYTNRIITSNCIWPDLWCPPGFNQNSLVVEINVSYHPWYTHSNIPFLLAFQAEQIRNKIRSMIENTLTMDIQWNFSKPTNFWTVEFIRLRHVFGSSGSKYTETSVKRFSMQCLVKESYRFIQGLVQLCFTVFISRIAEVINLRQYYQNCIINYTCIIKYNTFVSYKADGYSYRKYLNEFNQRYPVFYHLNQNFTFLELELRKIFYHYAICYYIKCKRKLL